MTEVQPEVPAAEVRPQRMCDVCGQVDDHPRHVFALAPGDGVTSPEIGAKALLAAGDDADLSQAILAQVMDTTTIMRHMDCCKEVGCPDGTCNIVTQGAEDLKGDALVAHLTEGN